MLTHDVTMAMRPQAGSNTLQRSCIGQQHLPMAIHMDAFFRALFRTAFFAFYSETDADKHGEGHSHAGLPSNSVSMLQFDPIRCHL
jgi:hypothetical protein